MRLKVLLAALMVALIPFTPVTPPAFAATDDWPQLQHDAQRTGASPAAVPGPHRFYWRWNSVPLAGRVQPVVVAGRLFIGSLDGSMYALDAAADNAGGAPSILWSRDLGSPVRAGAAVSGDTVIVGTQSGAVYGLNAATGAVRWRFLVGSAVLAAPLVADGAAFLGASDGVFYALDAASGALRWNVRLGGPILSSAALSSDGSTVFVASEEPAAYSLAAANGALRWRTGLQGQGSADRWPVVAGTTVVFRTQPLRHFHDLLQPGDTVLDQAGARKPDWAADWAAVAPKIVAHLTASPDRQTFFALDTAGGTSRGVLPVLYTFGQNDAPAPPVVRDGKLYLFYRTRHGIQNDSPTAVHVTTKYDADIGVLDPATLAISGLRASTTFSYQWRATSDEAATLSFAGPLLLVDNWERLGGTDVASGALTGIAQVSHTWNECNTVCQANTALMPFFSGAPTGIRNGDGGSRTAAVVAAGRIFWRVLEGGLAAIGPNTGGKADSDNAAAATIGDTAPLRSPTPTPRQPAPADFSSYVTTLPTRPIAAPPADLVQRLEDEVRRIVDTNGHLRPLFIERGFSTSQSWPPDTDKLDAPGQVLITHAASILSGNAYWYDPGELVYTLSMAYPYLSAGLQGRLKTYLKQELARYAPLEPLPFNNQAMPWLKQGVERSYALPFTAELNSWPPPAPPIQTLYALWAYGAYTGDWAYVGDRWAAVKALFDARKGSIDSYARIAGVIGYYRIAQQFGKSAESAEALLVANAAFTAGLDFAAFRSSANLRFPDSVINAAEPIGARAPVFFGLVPEVGRFLAENLAAPVAAEVSAHIGPQGARLWYATHAGTQGIEPSAENSFHGPDLAWSLFLARALAQGADRPTLRPLLDRPWCLGDLYYLQKLVATIEAPAAVAAPAAPVISGITRESSGTASATLRWATDSAASGWVEFGPTASYGKSSAIWLSPVEVHRITVDGLLPKTTYHYRVCSTGPGGTTCSPDSTFATAVGTPAFLPLVWG